MPEHTILVAFTVQGSNRDEAHRRLQAALISADTINPTKSYNGITSWWVAEDDREDRSDNDSAVFVKPGAQATAVGYLHGLGLTEHCNLEQGAESHFPEFIAKEKELAQRRRLRRLEQQRQNRCLDRLLTEMDEEQAFWDRIRA